MRPFFCYYGGKWRAAPRYPAPEHPLLVEPFAGAAGYATRYPGATVRLYDLDPVIVGVWSYLIKATAAEILSLPLQFDHVDEIHAPPEARWLVGFWLNKGAASPCKTPSAWMRSKIRPCSYWGAEIRARLAEQVEQIRHWTITEGDFTRASDHGVATWFIDPPYVQSGSHYRFKTIDYSLLATWCQARKGQVIVCEQEGAEWLPFRTFWTTKATPGSRGKSYSREVVWP